MTGHIMEIVADNILDTGSALDRKSWMRPLASVVITHHNYSTLIEDALLSLLDQTYTNWECVIIDDVSGEEHWVRLQNIVAKINSPKIKLIRAPENLGQILAFYAGVDATKGEFLCGLDPDDRWLETYLEEMIAAHLNGTQMCAIVSCDQMFFKNGAIISGTNTWFKRYTFEWVGDGLAKFSKQAYEGLLHIPAWKTGWHWTSTSGMVWRRPAVELCRPSKPLPARGSLDSYLALGCHALGGTIFLAKPLVFRGLHDSNDYITDGIFCIGQGQARPGRGNDTHALGAAVLEAIKDNGGAAQLARGKKWAPEEKKKRGLFSRLTRSFKKRWTKRNNDFRE